MAPGLFSALWAAAFVLHAGCEGATLASAPHDKDVIRSRSNPEVRAVATNDDVVSIYVYENVPELDHSFLLECYHDRYEGVPPWQDEIADMAENMGEIWLHQALLAHPWRVLDPEQADLFYVPIYPTLSLKIESNRWPVWIERTREQVEERRCQGSTHSDRMNAVVRYLRWSSPFFNRFGGSDHVIICSWWNCREAIGPWHRMLLRRTVVAIHEINDDWARWGCGAERHVTIPYTASSALTTTDFLGGLSPEERDIPFFFVGTSRYRKERENLKAIETISKESVIVEGWDQEDWGFDADQYASHIARSRFCFCPRGDTESSRRLFDAVAAGCIPIITQKGRDVAPYVEIGLDYSKLAIVVDNHALDTPEGVIAIASNLLARSDDELADLRRGLRAAMGTILYGATDGTKLSDMHPFLGTTTKFLQASQVIAEGGGGGREVNGGDMWRCPETEWHDDNLAARTNIQMPPDEDKIGLFLTESESIVNRDHNLLFCAAPNAGSLQFRMLAKRMQGLSHWNVADDRSMLFDRAASELQLLDVADEDEMKSIYHDNGSGWIKVSIVRDPITRLLSAYLDIVRTWRAGWHEYQQLQGQEPPLIPGGEDSPELHESSDRHHERRLQPRRDGEVSGHDRKARREGPPAAATTTGLEWSLLDKILDARRNRRRLQGEGPRGDREEEEEVETTIGGRERRWRRLDTDARGGKPNFHPFGKVEGNRKEEYERAVKKTRYPFKSRTTSDAEEAKEEQKQERKITTAATVTEEEWRPFSSDGSTTGDDDVPTFKELVEALRVDVYATPAAFRPTSSLCGQNFTQFDSIIPFERLQKTSVEVIKSLPGNLWESFGASGWGPEGKHAFMEFDYGAAEWGTDGGAHDNTVQPQEGGDEVPLPRRARDLFEEGSCAWAEYYGDVETLEVVGDLYRKDYNHHRWYKLDTWKGRLQECLDKRRG